MITWYLVLVAFGSHIGSSVTVMPMSYQTETMCHDAAVRWDQDITVMGLRRTHECIRSPENKP